VTLMRRLHLLRSDGSLGRRLTEQLAVHLLDRLHERDPPVMLQCELIDLQAPSLPLLIVRQPHAEAACQFLRNLQKHCGKVAVCGCVAGLALHSG